MRWTSNRVREAARRLRVGLVCVLLSLAAGATAEGARAAGTAIEYFNANLGHYFVTAFPEEAAALDAGTPSGWSRTGLTFPVDTDASGGGQPVCRFFSAAFAPKSSHFYTPYAAECATVKGNPTWSYEAIAFHLALPDAAGSCKAGATPIYRFYNNGVTGAPNHRYTRDASIVKLMKAQGWTPEGDGHTGVFACGPASAPSASKLIGTIEYNAALRYLTTGDTSAIVQQTETQIVFGRPVAIAPGDVFVVPENGTYHAVTVTTAGGRTTVDVEPPTLDEVFAQFDIDATLDLDSAALLPKSVVIAAKGASTPDKLFSVGGFKVYGTVDSNGNQGAHFEFKLDADCGPSSKLRLIDASAEIFGPIKVKGKKADIANSSVSYQYKLDAGAYVGCKLTVPLGSPLRLGMIPLYFEGIKILIPVYVSASIETDIGPSLQVVAVKADVTLPSQAGTAPTATFADKSLFTQLLQGLSAGTAYKGKATGEVDVSGRVVIPVIEFNVFTGGVKMGPQLSVTATAVLRAGTADVDLCWALTWPTELYIMYPSPRKLKTVTIFQKNFDIPYGSFNQCGVAPNGSWIFTTTACVPEPSNPPPPTCNVYCNPTINFTMSAKTDKSQIDLTLVGGSDVYVKLTPNTTAGVPPRTFSGCALGGGVCQPQVMVAAFASDYRTIPNWTFAGTYDGVCIFTQSGNAALQ